MPSSCEFMHVGRADISVFQVVHGYECYELILQVRGMYMHMVWLLLGVNYCMCFICCSGTKYVSSVVI